MLAVIQSNLADVGINVTIEAVDAGTAMSDLVSGNYDLFMMTLSYYDSLFTGASYLNAAMIGAANFPRYASSELDALVASAMEMAEAAERQEVANDILTHMQDDLPSMKLFDKALPICYNENLDVTLRVNNWVQIYDLQWKK